MKQTTAIEKHGYDGLSSNLIRIKCSQGLLVPPLALIKNTN
jgi:hypothetical protein